MPIPDNLTYVEAAAIPEVFVTAHEALVHLGGAKRGDWALIHAAGGGVGSAAVVLAKALEIKVIFTVKGTDRIDRVKALGGYIGVDYSEQDSLKVVETATDRKGVDVVIDLIGGPYLERNVMSLCEGAPNPGRISRWQSWNPANRHRVASLSAHYWNGHEIKTV